MGYAYCVGDLLIELDTAYNILNIDGAVKAMLGSDKVLMPGQSFIEYLSDQSRQKILSATKGLTGQNRVGPLDVELCFSVEISSVSGPGIR